MDEFLARNSKKNNIPRCSGHGGVSGRAPSNTRRPYCNGMCVMPSALHARVFILRIESLSTPVVALYGPALVSRNWRKAFGAARPQYGFMERPDVPGLLREAKLDGCDIDLDERHLFHRARNDRAPRTRHGACARVVEDGSTPSCSATRRMRRIIFACRTMRVVEIGREIAI